jgi:hypothetical protein
MRFHIHARYLVSCSLPRTLATCAAAVFDRQTDELKTFNPVLQSCPMSKMKDRHMSALLPRHLRCCDGEGA